MKSVKILEINVRPLSKYSILEKIKKYITQPRGTLQIVSINPENLVVGSENKDFKRIVETSQIQIMDGVGIILAGKILGIKLERITGGDLMEELLKLADELSSRVLLIGGRANLALRLAQCYSQIYTKAKFRGSEGIKNIEKPTQSEEKSLFSIVSDYKPHFVFVAFGSPEQELWIDRHKKQFVGIVCMGVGGAFDFAGKVIPRAPKFVRSIGLEWLFRLFVEPWRWRRQVSLFKFIALVIKQRLNL